MEDLSEFAVSHPDFCDPKAVRVPGHDRAPAIDGGRPFELSAESLSTYRVEAAKDPSTLPNMLKMGPEAAAFHGSFRPDPPRWGIYVREGAFSALKKAYHRSHW